MGDENKKEVIGSEPNIEASEASDKMRFKDWISILFSLAALIISFGSVYWNILRQVDQLSVAITGHNATASIDPTTRKLLVSDDNTLTLLNSGNRPVAITGMWLVVDDFPSDFGDEPEDQICYHRNTGAVYIPIGDAFVVQPGAVEIRKIFLKDRVTDRPANGEWIPQDPKEDRKKLLFCASFNFVLPDYQAGASIQVGGWEARVPDPSVRQIYATQVRTEPVYTLLSKWQTILDPYIKQMRERIGIKKPDSDND